MTGNERRDEMQFEEKGSQNTVRTLYIALEEAKKRGIGHVVVASTTGATGVAAAEKFADTGIQVIVVSHNSGFKDEGEGQIPPDNKARIEKFGGIVHSGTMVLRGLGTAIKNKGGFSQEELVANTLRMFGQGMKVCVEMAAMAADAGLIPFDDVICVAGTGRGADTCVLIRANSSNRFFNIKVREILAKPANF